MPGLINLDFADIRSIIQDAGSALMGIGRASGPNRAVEAARQATESPMVGVSIAGARGISSTSRDRRTSACTRWPRPPRKSGLAAHPEANIIFGACVDDRMGDDVQVTVIATGFDPGSCARPSRRPQRGWASPVQACAGMSQLRILPTSRTCQRCPVSRTQTKRRTRPRSPVQPLPMVRLRSRPTCPRRSTHRTLPKRRVRPTCPRRSTHRTLPKRRVRPTCPRRQAWPTSRMFPTRPRSWTRRNTRGRRPCQASVASGWRTPWPRSRTRRNCRRRGAGEALDAADVPDATEMVFASDTPGSPDASEGVGTIAAADLPSTGPR